MDAHTQARLEARTRILKALAHPARLLMVEELGKQERCVAELTRMVGSDMSTVSKHLSLLKGVGLVADHKRGTQVFYRLAAPCALNFFACLESVMQANLQTHIQLAEPGRLAQPEGLRLPGGLAQPGGLASPSIEGEVA